MYRALNIMPGQNGLLKPQRLRNVSHIGIPTLIRTSLDMTGLDYLMPSHIHWVTLAVLSIGGLALSYAALWGLPSIRSFERGAIYMHGFNATPKKDLRIPEKFGFGHGQVASFTVVTPDGVALHVWHILPIGLYVKHEKRLARTGTQSNDAQATFNFQLLRDDPEARLVIHTHGSSGTMASAWRVNSYRAFASAAPDKVHVLTFDYRGFGLSEGSPSEEGIITDATTVFDWAVNTAGVPPERIVFMGHSLGAGVAIGLAHRLMKRDVYVAGLVLSAGFVDTNTIAKTFAASGVPILKPLQVIPGLVEAVTSKLESTWKNADRLSDIIRYGKRYHIEIIHAQNDRITTYRNGVELYRRALQAGCVGKTEDSDLGQGGIMRSAQTQKGLIRLAMPLFGDHDGISSHTVAVAAIMRTLGLHNQP